MAVEAANQRQRQYYLRDLPALFDSLQRVEVSRLDLMKQLFERLATANYVLTAPTTQRTQSFLQSAQNMNSQKDFESFVSALTTHVGTAELPNDYTYELQLTPQQIRSAASAAASAATPDNASTSDDASAAPSSSSSARVFGVPLSALPLDSTANSNNSVPLILSSLLSHLRFLHATSQPDLFRHSGAHKTELGQLRVALEQAAASNSNTELVNLISGVANPHLLAAVLKLWLRSLPQPLLLTTSSSSASLSLYAAAIDLTKKHENLFTPIACNRVREVVSGLSPIAQHTLEALSDFVAEMCALAATATVTMEAAKKTGGPAGVTGSHHHHAHNPRSASDEKFHTLAQLAAVFAPMLLQSPSTDATELLLNQKNEVRFISSVFYALSFPDAHHTTAPAPAPAPATVAAATAAATTPAAAVSSPSSSSSTAVTVPPAASSLPTSAAELDASSPSS